MRSAKFFDHLLLTDSALHCYNEVYTKFPTYPKANLALFSQAYIYANEKQNLPKAAMLYKEYLSKYPATSLAKSAALELQNLGKSPDQIMAELDSIRMAGKVDSTTTQKSKGK
jgi:hypothetical protein